MNKLSRLYMMIYIIILQNEFHRIFCDEFFTNYFHFFFFYHTSTTSLFFIGLAVYVLASITLKIALAVSRLVKQAIPCSTAVLLIINPSDRGCLPDVSVLITN